MHTYKTLTVLSLTLFISSFSTAMQAEESGLHPFFIQGGPADQTQAPATVNRATTTTATPPTPTAGKRAPTYITDNDGPFNQVDKPAEHFRKHTLNTERRRVETRENAGAQPYNPQYDERKVLNSFGAGVLADLFDFSGDRQPATQNGNTATATNTSNTPVQTSIPVEKESVHPTGPRRDAPKILHPINIF